MSLTPIVGTNPTAPPPVIGSFTSERVLRGISTPCARPNCSHVADYGSSTCCVDFLDDITTWTRRERARMHANIPAGSRAYVESYGVHWSGGTATLPNVGCREDTGSGWHNGSLYTNRKTYDFVVMPGFAPVYRE